MKKLMSAVVMGSLLLGACSEEAVKEETKAVEETKEPAKKEAEKKELVDTSTYTESMSKAMGNISDSLGSLTDQTIKLTDNPYLMTTDDWIMDTAMAITSFDVSIEQVRDIEPPNVPELKEAHNLVLEAMDYYQFTVDNYPTAIDNMDVDLLNECTANMGKATEKIQAATKIIDDYKASL